MIFNVHCVNGVFNPVDFVIHRANVGRNTELYYGIQFPHHLRLWIKPFTGECL